MKKIFLPKLKNIKIENFSLYSQSPSFEFNFLDGISAIIGINGIGKTTFVEMIMYCLLGHKRKDIKKTIRKTKKNKIEYENENYFKDRMDDRYNKKNEAKVYLTFKINDDLIKIGRSLSENQIIYLSLNNQVINDTSEEYYQELISSLTRIASFESIEKVIRHFLFFDEQRKNIAWEAETQDQLLRILLFEEEFFNRFEYLESEITKLDTLGRHTSEERKALLRTYEELIQDKERILNKTQNNSINNIEYKTNNEDLNKLKTKYNELEQIKTDLQIELEDLIEKNKEQNSLLNNFIGKRNNILLNIENIDNNMSLIESKLYSSIYDDLPEFYIAIERTLCNNGECLICGAKSKKLKEEAMQKSKNSQCLVCSSELRTKEKVDYNIIEELNNLNNEKVNQNNILENINIEIKKIQNIIENFNNNIKNLNEQFNNKKYEIMLIEASISEKSSENTTDTLSEILNEKEKRVEQLTYVINKAYRERDERKKELQILHNDFKKIIKKLNSSFSKYFNKYASTFMGLDCELTVKERTINKIPHVLYLPIINNEIRNDIWAVSESQRFFIDQAFRMAIIDYLSETISGFETFFITETPEGSLDISYESKVAEMFLLFSESRNNIIFTSNLNSSKFLLEVFKNIPQNEKKSRVLNLLQKGNITKVQDESMPVLQNIFREVIGRD